ncbi:hypothetical protein NLJ89_g1028 [Agrocybe chaxingu]|uniref:Uncharacterized protein n=1 Tax=Agrocybe chaxingu TaxID=84603 RepID=A0A9W8N0U9_9AGAR|nr:hypothetical protein NLJ89_g1028 [Agrocybe chaxingu]
MSRGDRIFVSGNLSSSMRENYEHGVAEYYVKVGNTYRNPHFPGIRLCLFAWLNNGEATLAFIEWYNTGKKLYQESHAKVEGDRTSRQSVIPRRKGVVVPVPLDLSFPGPSITAADPFTSAAYRERTSYPCAELSFEDVAEGLFPSMSIDISSGAVLEHKKSEGGEDEDPEGTKCQIEMVVCSFALHLIENPSGLFALLSQLSLKARWLVVLAPHKKPEIKEGWGWRKWDVAKWAECEMVTPTPGEFLYDRSVHHSRFVD